MQIQRDDFIQKLLTFEKLRKHIPDVTGKRNRFLKKQTDAWLVKYIRRGNRKAFDVLILRHENKIKHLLRMNLFDKSLTDDAWQDVCEKVVHALRSRDYKENGHFYGWLSTVAFRKAMKVNRQKQYDPEMVVYDFLLHDRAEPSDEEASDSVLQKAQKIISTLSERDRQIIGLHHEEGLTFEMIARQLNLNQRSVRVWHARSMKRIKDSLRKHQQTDTGLL